MDLPTSEKILELCENLRFAKLELDAVKDKLRENTSAFLDLRLRCQHAELMVKRKNEELLEVLGKK